MIFYSLEPTKKIDQNEILSKLCKVSLGFEDFKMLQNSTEGIQFGAVKAKKEVEIH